MLTVSDVVADGLARAGTARVFAVAGEPRVSALLDAMRRRGLEVVPARGAAAACLMAAVTGTLAEVPGAAAIAGGRGAALATEGVAYAFFDRAPLVVLTAGAGSPSADPRASLGPITKATLGVAADSAAHWIAHACQLAMKEPWGPVHLDVAADVEGAAALPIGTVCRPVPLPAADAAALDAAARLLATATRPLVVVGLQLRSEADATWLRAFAEALPAPVLVTRKAKGALADPHPLVMGTFGEGGGEEAELLEAADLVVAVGLDPVEVRPRGWPAQTPVLHLAAAAPQASPHYQITVALVGDIGLVLEELAPRLRERKLADWDVARLHALKQAMASPPPARSASFAAYRMVEAARQLTSAGTVAVFDAGEHLGAALRAWPAVAPGECLVPGRLATDGFALPAAIAAQLARREQRVVCLTEPHALRAAVAELDTLAALALPVLVVVFREAAAPSLLALARGAGVTGFTAGSTDEFRIAFVRALEDRAPAVIEATLSTG